MNIIIDCDYNSIIYIYMYTYVYIIIIYYDLVQFDEA